MDKLPVIVTGGAGYVGSHAVRVLRDAGYHPIIVDNLERGRPEIVDALGVECIQADIRDQGKLEEIFAAAKPHAVMHFAAYALVGESINEPELYYSNNVYGALALLQTMRRHGVKIFIFSSTCAVYGIPQEVPITEQYPRAPINPYGWSKFMVEQMLANYASAYGLRAMVFRYFNAAGSDAEAGIGEWHVPETHLIPLAIEAAYTGETFHVYGDDYETPDGTCIRDYVHVRDIADAHAKGLKVLSTFSDTTSFPRYSVFNIGTGTGYSVSEVLAAVEKETGKSIARSSVARRQGDPPQLVADARALRELLNWQPQHSTLPEIVESAVRWYRQQFLRADNT